MLLLSLNQYRNIYIWLAFKVLSQCNMKETEQSYSLHEENCQCIICLSVTVSQHPFILGRETLSPIPCDNLIPCDSHVSVDVPDFLALL